MSNTNEINEPDLGNKGNGNIPAEAPTTLKNIKWVRLHWKEHLCSIILLGVITIVFAIGIPLSIKFAPSCSRGGPDTTKPAKATKADHLKPIQMGKTSGKAQAPIVTFSDHYRAKVELIMRFIVQKERVLDIARKYGNPEAAISDLVYSIRNKAIAELEKYPIDYVRKNRLLIENKIKKTTIVDQERTGYKIVSFQLGQIVPIKK